MIMMGKPRKDSRVLMLGRREKSKGGRHWSGYMWLRGRCLNTIRHNGQALFIIIQMFLALVKKDIPYNVGNISLCSRRKR